eukprot:COSAG05_NODE_1750_length_4147_cov_2.788538_1_plen_63_part_00
MQATALLWVDATRKSLADAEDGWPAAAGLRISLRDGKLPGSWICLAQIWHMNSKAAHAEAAV